MLFDDAILIGKVIKARSAKGDVQINLTNIGADMCCGKFLILDIDGLKVPFKIERLEKRGNCMFAKFEECTESHDYLTDCNVYCQKEDLKEITEEALSQNPNVLKGFKVFDTATQRKLGEITNVDTSTANLLIYVQGKKEILIPLAEEFIEEFDTTGRTIRLHLPEGLTGINDKN